MHLLNTKTLEFELFFGNIQTPSYAILSHTWGTEELSFQDVLRGDFFEFTKTRNGYVKIQSLCSLARANSFDYVWIDTCCIDKTSSAELSEAINSMFDWYQNAAVCYAYLEDLPAEPVVDSDLKSSLSKCKWFTRGWTLQELLAPSEVVFLNQNWVEVGTKKKLADVVSDITGIPKNFLLGDDPRGASAAQRMSWAARRQTRRIEDTAYCLMGLFGVHMSMLYGEGTRAFIRLQEEIVNLTDDLSIFAWTEDLNGRGGIFSTSPAAFANCGQIVKVKFADTTPGFTNTTSGIQLEVRYMETRSDGRGFIILPCGVDDRVVAIPMRATSAESALLERDESDKVRFIDLRSLKKSQYAVKRILARARPTGRSWSRLSYSLEANAKQAYEPGVIQQGLPRNTTKINESTYAGSAYTESTQSAFPGHDDIFSTNLSRTNSNLTLSSLFSNEPVPETIVGQFLAILVSDDVLQPLYNEALRGRTPVQRSRFEAQFVVLLEKYRSDLVAQSPDEEEKRVVWLLQQQRRQFARFISEQFSIDDGDRSGKWADLISQKPDKLAETERYLSSLNLQIEDGQEDLSITADNTERASADDALKPYPNYERLKKFLTNGKAFVLLRGRLRELVRRETSDHLYPILESETDHESVEQKQDPHSSSIKNTQMLGTGHSLPSGSSDLTQIQTNADESTPHNFPTEIESGVGHSTPTVRSELVPEPTSPIAGTVPPLVLPSNIEDEPSSLTIIEPSERTPLISKKTLNSSRGATWTRIILPIAEFFGRERPLQEGKKRWRWKCCCGKPFYHDYSDFPEMGEPRDVIHSGDAAAEANLAAQAWSYIGPTPAPVANTRPSLEITGEAAGQSPQDAENLQIRTHGNVDTAIPQDPSESWIFLRILFMGIGKVIPLPAHEQTDDKALFTAFRQAYFKRKSYWNLFWNLRAVTKVDIGMFRLTDSERQLAGKPTAGVWPCLDLPLERVDQLKRVWSYKPCPIDKNRKDEPEPPVPSDWILHLWNHPDHAAAVDESAPLLSGIFGRTNPPAPPAPPAEDLERQNERRGVGGRRPSRTAVLIATPKRLAPVPRAGNELPKLWGLYCEEGFRVSWVFFAIVVVYLFASLAFAVAWYVEHGTGPQAGLGSFGVLVGWWVCWVWVSQLGLLRRKTRLLH